MRDQKDQSDPFYFASFYLVHEGRYGARGEWSTV